MIKIPDEYLLDSIGALISSVFHTIEEGYTDRYFVSRQTILTPINENVDKINDIIMNKFSSEGKIYNSADPVAED